MNTTTQCLTCLYEQAKRTLQLLDSTPESNNTQILHKKKNMTKDCAPHIFGIPTNPPVIPPPQLAITVYKHITQLTNTTDPYQLIKAQSIAKAKEFLQKIPLRYDLEWGIKIAALGNVIDYGNSDAFRLDSCLFEAESIHFSIYDIQALQTSLQGAKKLVYIGDNAGEDVFDSVLVQILTSLYPQLAITYFTRGAPIINDSTLQDLQTHQSPILDVCEVVDSGVESAGFLYEFATSYAKKLYDEADVILAKGMGNFECLEDCNDKRVFLLFKIKCDVVAKFIGEQRGSFVLKNAINE